MSKNITLEQFIIKSKNREKDRLKLSTMNIKGFGSVQLHSIGFDKLIAMVDGLEDAPISVQVAVNKEVVYKSMPMLSNPELQSQFELYEPWDIVYQIFTLSEVNEIIEHLMKLNGVDGIGVDEVKN